MELGDLVSPSSCIYYLGGFSKKDLFLLLTYSFILPFICISTDSWKVRFYTFEH